MIQRSGNLSSTTWREVMEDFDYSMDNVKGQYAAMLSIYQLITSGRR